MEEYDEDLTSNIFYKTLRSQHKALFSEACRNRRILCIPCKDSYNKDSFTEEDFKTHILIDDGGEASSQNVCRTLNDKEVAISGQAISLGFGFTEKLTVKILFEESFFNDNDESFPVFCISQPLQVSGRVLISQKSTDSGEVHSDSHSSVTKTPSFNPYSIKDCVSLLWNERKTERTKVRIDNILRDFIKCWNNQDEPDVGNLSVLAKNLYMKCLQILYNHSYYHKIIQSDKVRAHHIKVALETYVSVFTFRKVFSRVAVCAATYDEVVNKAVRNLSELPVQAVGIREEFVQNIQRSKKELATLNDFSNPLGKLATLRRSIRALSHVANKQLRNGIVKPSSTLHTESKVVAFSSDDLLPTILFLITKSDITNWYANILYMQHFRFSDSSIDEYGYCLASFEAALEHVVNEQSKYESAIDKILMEQRYMTRISESGNSCNDLDEAQKSDHINLFFAVQNANLEKIRCILQKPSNGDSSVLEFSNIDQSGTSDVRESVCHPLCSCVDCCRNTNRPSKLSRYSSMLTPNPVNASDEFGTTALHVASWLGYIAVIELLLKLKAGVNIADTYGCTPLHLACRRGHQNVCLLLIHHGANINCKNNVANTPLHLSAQYGHEDCVKALVFYDRSSILLDISAQNDQGFTALHYAAKFGFRDVVEILLENGIDVNIRNKRGVSADYLANNLKLQTMIRKAGERVEERRDSGIVNVFSRNSLGSIDSLASLALSEDHFGNDPQHETRVISPSADEMPFTKMDMSAKSLLIEKLLKAVATGDYGLVCFYLGLGDNNAPKTPDGSQRVSQTGRGEMRNSGAIATPCHPLCQCDKCLGGQENAEDASATNRMVLELDCSNSDGYSAIHVAALHGRYKVAELLIRNNCRLNAPTVSHGCTPLHLACRHNHHAVVDILLRHGCRVNTKDSRGNSALHYCCTGGHEQCARLLLQYGADVGQRNLWGSSPLQEACKWNNVTMIHMLKQHGAMED